MKNYFWCLSAACLLATSVGAVTVDTDLARDRAASGNFTNAAGVTNGILTADKAAVSGDIANEPQFLTIDLGTPAYIQRIKIFWDKNAYSDNYEIRTSLDAKSWYAELAGADAASGVIDNRTGTISQTITGKRFGALSRYVQIYIPLGSQVTNPIEKKVKISSIQVFPAAELKIAIEDVSAYVVTDSSAIVNIRSNIGAVQGSVYFGLTPDRLDKPAAIYDTGVQTSATLPGLISGRTYFYQARVWDAYGNMAESQVKTFAPAKENLALGKAVAGTFTELPPKDPYVAPGPVLPRITDGGTSYFTSMATSRSVKQEDQYCVIDLGKTLPVANVVLYWRNLAYPQDFSILVSNDGSTFSAAAETLNAGQGAFSRSDTGDPIRVVSADLKGMTARYVKVLVKKDAAVYDKHADWDFVQLMEAQVYPK